MIILYDSRGRKKKVNFSIDAKEHVASGEYFTYDPTKKRTKEQVQEQEEQNKARELAEKRKQAEEAVKAAIRNGATMPGISDLPDEDEEDDDVPDADEESGVKKKKKRNR